MRARRACEERDAGEGACRTLHGSTLFAKKMEGAKQCDGGTALRRARRDRALLHVICSFRFVSYTLFYFLFAGDFHDDAEAEAEASPQSSAAAFEPALQAVAAAEFIEAPERITVRGAFVRTQKQTARRRLRAA